MKSMNHSLSLTTNTLATHISAREIVYRTRGMKHGPITRLVSPSDLGELIKPFVFLDLFETESAHAMAGGFGWHPHSGIATITHILEGEASYEDSTGKKGILKQRGVEWMRAGGGVWHTGKPVGKGPMRGFQLWIALPEELELAPPESTYLAPEEVPQAGPVRVVLGCYGSARSPIISPPNLNYLAVHLKDGEQWRFEPEPEHNIAWVAVQTGQLDVGSTIEAGELAIFSESDAHIDFRAKGNTVFMLGSASKHPHDLVLGNYSVHTSTGTLREGEEGIKQVAKRLKSEGLLT